MGFHRQFPLTSAMPLLPLPPLSSNSLKLLDFCSEYCHIFMSSEDIYATGQNLKMVDFLGHYLNRLDNSRFKLVLLEKRHVSVFSSSHSPPTKLNVGFLKWLWMFAQQWLFSNIVIIWSSLMMNENVNCGFLKTVCAEKYIWLLQISLPNSSRDRHTMGFLPTAVI